MDEGKFDEEEWNEWLGLRAREVEEAEIEADAERLAAMQERDRI